MTKSLWQTPGWRGELTAILAGTLISLSLAPYNIWPLGIVASATLAILLQGLNGKQGLKRAFAFGVGMFGGGTSWVYVAISEFGYTAAPLAALLTAIFVLGLALVFALPFYLYCRFLSGSRLGFILGFTATWVLGEWLRSWLLTGFPWLYLGYAHVDTWLAGWAPVIGVFGLSFACVLTGTLITELIYEIARLANRQKDRNALLPFSYIVAIAAVWGSAFSLEQQQWVEINEEQSLSVAIVQPNIPLEQKWDYRYRGEILNTLREQSAPHWDKDIILWPEAAVPQMFHDAEEFLSEIDQQAKSTNTAVITGILYDDPSPGVYYNSIIGLGDGAGQYFKQRLVPFGEYVPMEKWLRGLIDFFNLPNSVLFPGPKNQEILSTDKYKIAPSICYEIVYPDLVASAAEDAHILVTISNDAWFGDSIGPLQHFQMAQMRAIENRRYVIRSTNTGLSGIISPSGKTILEGTQFRRESISARVYPAYGSTPFTRWGSLPIVLLCGVISIMLTLVKMLREDTPPPH